MQCNLFGIYNGKLSSFNTITVILVLSSRQRLRWWTMQKLTLLLAFVVFIVYFPIRLMKTVAGPSIQVQFNGTMTTSYPIDSSCVRKYVQQFGTAFYEQITITQSALDSRFLCQSMSLGTQLTLVPFLTTNQIQSTVVSRFSPFLLMFPLNVRNVDSL
jgi:hypothetical protein